ncbi:MAG: acyloxyacyl hydrolase [Alphaproteobacteria bacterium]|nr:acyloxyacyl hydrolase [Alphaproteobacteria bacterium]
MKKILTTALIATLITTAADARRDDLYIGFRGEFLSSDISYYGHNVASPTGVGFGITIGSQYWQTDWIYLRSGLELSYRDMSDFRSYGFVQNVYMDIGLDEWTVRPYIGVGAGFRFMSLPDTPATGAGDDFGGGLVFVARTGITYELTERFKMDVGVLWDTTWSFDDWRTNNIGAYVGVRWHFGQSRFW